MFEFNHENNSGDILQTKADIISAHFPLLSLPHRNLTNKGVGGELPTRFGSMDRLTVLDLSNNSFQGGLPSSLAQVVTLRAL